MGTLTRKIIAAASQRMALGTSFGVTTEIEEQMARKVTEMMPSIESVRFVSSGTEATMTAARLARGYTGRDLLVKFAGHYHGHADFFLVQAGSGVFGLSPTSSSAGIPEACIKDTICLTFNDLAEMERVLLENRQRIAAVILEPISGNMGLVPSKPEFLQALRKMTREIGALLIFDEVMTGFRVHRGGAQALYGIEPDLTCLGKIVGGGFPAAAFGGRREIMNFLAPLGPVYQAGTLSGNPVAMEAGYQSLRLLEAAGFYESLQAKTDLITKPVQAYLTAHHIPACIQQVGSMFTLFFGLREVRHMEDAKQLNTSLFAQFFRWMYARGIYVPPSQYEAWFLSSAHTEEHLTYTRNVMLEFLQTVV